MTDLPKIATKVASGFTSSKQRKTVKLQGPFTTLDGSDEPDFHIKRNLSVRGPLLSLSEFEGMSKEDWDDSLTEVGIKVEYETHRDEHRGPGGIHEYDAIDITEWKPVSIYIKENGLSEIDSNTLKEVLEDLTSEEENAGIEAISKSILKRSEEYEGSEEYDYEPSEAEYEGIENAYFNR